MEIVRLWDVFLVNGEAIAGRLYENEARNIAAMYGGVALPSDREIDPYSYCWYSDKVYRHLETLDWFNRDH